METAYINGRFVEPSKAMVSIQDRGFLFADGVYEVIASYDSVPLALDRHLIRLQRSLDELRIPLDVEEYGMENVVEQLVDQTESADALIYIQVTRGVAPRRHEFPNPAPSPTVVLTTSALAPLPQWMSQEGVSCVAVPNQRWGRCDIKTVSLLPNVLARQHASEAGAFEALLLDAENRVLEGSSTSSFCVCDAQLRTTPLGPSILPGITRELAIEAARELDLVVREEETFLEDYLNAQEVFITGTSIDALPVVNIDDHVIGTGSPGPVTRRLAEALRLQRSQPQETGVPDDS